MVFTALSISYKKGLFDVHTKNYPASDKSNAIVNKISFRRLLMAQLMGKTYCANPEKETTLLTREDCIEFAVQNPVCTVATVDADQPKARIFMMWRADDSGFYFCTRTKKRVCKELQANPNVELCFYKPGADPTDMGAMLRVSGTAEFVDDISLKERLLSEWAFLKEMGVTGAADPDLSIFRLTTGRMDYWTSNGVCENIESVIL